MPGEKIERRRGQETKVSSAILLRATSVFRIELKGKDGLTREVSILAVLRVGRVADVAFGQVERIQMSEGGRERAVERVGVDVVVERIHGGLSSSVREVRVET